MLKKANVTTMIFCMFSVFLAFMPKSMAETIVWSENFEQGWGGWTVDNGVWNIDTVAVGPDTLLNGKMVAGTNLKGNYPDYANTRLKSPWIHLPTLEENELLSFYFEHWFMIDEVDAHGPDNGRVEISLDDENWTPVSSMISGFSPIWTHNCVNLTPYQNLEVKLAFYFESNQRGTNKGWYIDSLRIAKLSRQSLDFCFDQCNNEWYADNGLWQIGPPSNGPFAPHSGCCCAVTVLDSMYQPYGNSRLISPQIHLIPKKNEKQVLHFWHCFKINETDAHGPDRGFIQISVNDGPWHTLGSEFSGDSQGWSPEERDLSAFADSLIRIAFYFESNQRSEDWGWFIDDVSVSGTIATAVRQQDRAELNFCLMPNYPNPFNPTTTIEFYLPRSEQVRLCIINAMGQTVKTLINEQMAAGKHSMFWDGRDEVGHSAASGLYLYQITAGEFSKSYKMLLMR